MGERRDFYQDGQRLLYDDDLINEECNGNIIDGKELSPDMNKLRKDKEVNKYESIR